MGSITRTNHAQVSLTLNLGADHTRVCHSRLNENLLKKPQHREGLQKHIVDYFHLNEGSVFSTSALWEAHKAVIRDHCIAMGTRIKKDVALQTETLLLQLRSLEERLSVKPTCNTRRKMVEIHAKLKTLALGKAEKLLLYSRQ